MLYELSQADMEIYKGLKEEVRQFLLKPGIPEMFFYLSKESSDLLNFHHQTKRFGADYHSFKLTGVSNTALMSLHLKNLFRHWGWDIQVNDAKPDEFRFYLKFPHHYLFPRGFTELEHNNPTPDVIFYLNDEDKVSLSIDEVALKVFLQHQLVKDLTLLGESKLAVSMKAINNVPSYAAHLYAFVRAQISEFSMVHDTNKNVLLFQFNFASIPSLEAGGGEDALEEILSQPWDLDGFGFSSANQKTDSAEDPTPETAGSGDWDDFSAHREDQDVPLE